MTPSNINLTPFTKLCRKGLHEYDATKKLCPECSRATKASCQLRNRERYVKANSDRYYSNYERSKAEHAEYRKKNREKINARQLKSYHENLELRRKQSAKYCQKNRELAVWRAMVLRCTDTKNKQYEDYGARGINVHSEWLGENGYKVFLRDMGKRPSDKHTLDRKNNDLGYTPDNCRWVLPIVQGRNKRNNHLIEYNGKTQCLSAWAGEVGVGSSTLARRITFWGIDRAMTQKPRIVNQGFHRQLCDRGAAWLRDEKSCHTVFTECARNVDEKPDAIGWSGESTYLVECKTTRTNFFDDAKKKMRLHPDRGVGLFRYYLVPKGMVLPKDVPEKWGLLYDGDVVQIVKEAVRFDVRNIEAETHILSPRPGRWKNGANKSTP
jgi:hypothetical protein